MFIKAVKEDDGFPYITEGIYLHGQLESLNNYDLVYLDRLPEEPGIYQSDVEIDGEIYHAALYFWYKNGKARGLIVAPNDTVAITDAILKFGREDLIV